MEQLPVAAETPGIDSFFGELDELFTEFIGTDLERRDDDAIMARIAGVFDSASEYYREDLNRTVLLVGALSLQLSQMVCTDDHFARQIGRRFGPDSSLEDQHDHHTDDLDTHDSGKKDARKAEANAAVRLGFYGALFTYKPMRPKLSVRSLYKAAS